MNELTLFKNPEFGTIRSLIIKGEPWFVGKEIAEALGYTNPRKALADHVDSEDKNTVTIRDGIKGNPNKTIINESGMYSLILSSKLQSAKRFKRWVTSEVLPAIRKTGSYSTHEEYDRIELARIISSCKSATAVKTISAMFNIGVKTAEKTIKYGNDSVSKFLESYDSKLLQVIPNRVIYTDYVSYCCENDLEIITQGNFSRRVHRLMGLVVKRRRVNGELTGFFTVE